MTCLILASASPHRLELLVQAGYRVEAVASGLWEPDLTTFPDLETGLVCLARLKAQGVSNKGFSGLILGADTVSWAAGRILGKPEDRERAREMLELLSGTQHAVLTGWCLLRTRDSLCVCGVERTEVTMRRWTAPEIEAYLDGGAWQGKCGAYGLELPNDPFVTRLEGSASNVIGVPLERLQAVLEEFPELAT